MGAKKKQIQNRKRKLIIKEEKTNLKLEQKRTGIEKLN
jgi:hypothetical protein